jgi:solute carrier family 36 (proton-coupled amino acid transporter)
MSKEQLGTFNTYMTLTKGFICTGILYLPKVFTNGGWGFSTFSIIASAILNYWSLSMLLEVRQRLNANSYTECGKLIFGKKGEYIVNLALGISQLSFCISFLYFIIGNSVTIIV